MIVGLDLDPAPVCDAAFAQPSRLSKADHRFVPIRISGVTDEGSGVVDITIDSIFQDEAVDALGSGNTAPDGRGVGTDTAEVRAERVAGGNGRVYHIAFTATDSAGGACSGEVLVGVPGTQGRAIDDGPQYDSTATP